MEAALGQDGTSLQRISKHLVDAGAALTREPLGEGTRSLNALQKELEFAQLTMLEPRAAFVLLSSYQSSLTT
jgi:hypothetical protein